MRRQTTRLLVELVALAFLSVIFLVGFALWRLSHGPVDLELLRPSAEAVFTNAFQGETVQLGEIESEWRPEHRAFVVTARDVTIRSAAGEVITIAPQISAALPAASLAQQRFAPLWVRAEGGAFSLVRRPDGEFVYGFGGPSTVAETAEPSERSGPGFTEMLADWRNLALPDEAANLTELSLTDVTLFVRDAATGLRWRIDEAGLQLVVAGPEIDVEISGALRQSSGAAPVTLTMNANSRNGALNAYGEISRFRPDLSAPSEGSLRWMSRLHAPLGLNGEASVGADGRLSEARLALSAGAGRVDIGGGAEALESAELNLRYGERDHRLVIESAALDSDMLDVTLSGALTGVGDERRGYADMALEARDIRIDAPRTFENPLLLPRLSLEGAIARPERRIEAESLIVEAAGLTGDFSGYLDFDEAGEVAAPPTIHVEGGTAGSTDPQSMLDFWPLDFADGGRVWIDEHVDEGRIHSAELDLTITPEALARGRLDDDQMSLRFAMDQGVVRYVSTMSPVTGGKGTAVLRGNSFSLELEEGWIGDIELTEGRVEIPRLKPKGAPATISGAANASVRDVVALLDEEPLGFPSQFGIDPQNLDGQGSLKFQIVRPMRSLAPIERVGFDVTGEFDDVSAPTGIGDIRLTGGAVNIEADPYGLTARGAGRLGPVEAEIRWRELFGEPEDADSTRFAVKAVMDQADFDALGLPVRQYLTGPVLVSANTEGAGLEIKRGEAAVNLGAATLTAPGGFWRKPEGEAAEAAIVFARDETGLELSEIRFQARETLAAGSARFGPKGRLLEAFFPQIVVPEFADLSASLTRQDERFAAELEGPYLDARWLVENAMKARTDAGGLAFGFDAAAAIDQVRVSDALTLTGFDLTASHSGESITALSIGATAGEDPAALDLWTLEDGSRRLTASADNAGLLFSALFGVDQVRGGAFALEGESAAAKVPWDMDVRVDDFTVVRAPILARLLGLASLEGLADVLGGTGLDFTSLSAPVIYEQGVLTLEQARAAGPALGVTMDGEIDLRNDQLALNGVLVPSYGLNTSFGALPVIGELLTSREGEGVIALTYTVDGPFDETQIAVNPLSALAPGIFRRIFEGQVTLDEAQAAADEAPAPGTPVQPEEPPG